MQFDLTNIWTGALKPMKESKSQPANNKVIGNSIKIATWDTLPNQKRVIRAHSHFTSGKLIFLKGIFQEHKINCEIILNGIKTEFLLKS